MLESCKEFGYPEFDAEGVKRLTSLEGMYQDMGMEITVYRMKAGDTRTWREDRMEQALLLVTGEVEYRWENRTERVGRGDFIKEGLYCLHTCRGIEVTVTACGDAELLVQRAENDRSFPSVFYTPKECIDAKSGVGLCDGVAERTVRTVFDYRNAPYSNMVLGEIIGKQGGWTSYVPHSHEQPEVYYYRFDKPQGFGACFIGDHVYKVTDGSFAAITPNETHPQASAPGYPEYVVWMIRHLPGNPWTDRVDDPAHLWMVKEKIVYR